MTKLTVSLLAVGLSGTFLFPIYSHAQSKEKPEIIRPTSSTAQEMNNLNTVPKGFKTEFIVTDEEGRRKCEFLMELYKIIETDPTVEKMLPYVSEDYIQHNPMLGNGPEALAMFFRVAASEYPVKIEVHRIIVVDKWAWVHLNFRNMDTEDPNDLGSTGVDIFTFGPDGKLTEHWDAVQNIPAFSANTNGMLLQIRED
ncbi:MAG: nuclear transport factor 2 family protein [Bacteroidota bacterium]